MDRRTTLSLIVSGVVTVATVLGAAATGPAALGCRTSSCRLIECAEVDTAATTKLSVPFVRVPPYPELQVTMCRGTDCVSDVLNAFLTRRDTSDETTVRCGGQPTFGCGGGVDPATGTLFLTVFRFESVEGEVLSVKVTAQDDTVVAERSGVVTRGSYYPNGSDCDPECITYRF